jgi:SAM-dependent methyltransferase
MSGVVLPLRYHTRWRQPYEDNISARLRDGMTILDIGAGRHPTLDAADRPARTTYVGLDISGDEMRAAGPNAYDAMQAADITSLVPTLVDSVDLAVSWQVFEHVKAMDVALDNIHRYLHVDGALVSLFSGKWSAFGILNQVVPDAIGHRIVERVMSRRAQNVPVFPAYYHRCSARQLRKMTVAWRSVEIVPLFRGATYFNFSALLTRMYLRYEEQARRRRADNLATHYLLIARK